MDFTRNGVKQATIVVPLLRLDDDDDHWPYRIMNTLPRRMAESFSHMKILRSLRLELGQYEEKQMQDFSEEMGSMNVWLPNLRSLRVSPPSLLERVMKHCDHGVLKILGLKGDFETFNIDEAKKIKDLERLHLTIVNSGEIDTPWAWMADRPQLWTTLREPQFSGLKWLNLHWEQDYSDNDPVLQVFGHKARVLIQATKLVPALLHLECLVVTFRDACGSTPALSHAAEQVIFKSVTKAEVSKAVNLKEFWIVSSCSAYGAICHPDGTVRCRRVKICNFDPEDPSLPWCRRDE
ncbi:hypothetical protein ACHAPI_005667 [Fusarium lateritium]